MRDMAFFLNRIAIALPVDASEHCMIFMIKVAVQATVERIEVSRTNSEMRRIEGVMDNLPYLTIILRRSLPF
jgi:hypothetical protein